MRGPLTTVFVMILGGVAAQGHHSISAVYDRARPVTLELRAESVQLFRRVREGRDP